MKHTAYSRPLALFLCVLVASPTFSSLSGAERAAALGRILPGPPAQVNGIALPVESTLLDGDRIATGANGSARVFLARGEQIHLGAQSEARATRQGESLALELTQGRVAMRTHGRDFRVRSNGLVVAPTADNAIWEVARLREGRTLVASLKGSVQVRASNRTVEIPAGQSVQMETALLDQGGGGGASTLTQVLVIGGILGGLLTTAIVATFLGGDDPVVSVSVP